MLLESDWIRKIAEKARRDFEEGDLNAEELRRAVRYAPEYAVDEFHRDVESALDPASTRPPFPHGYSQLATIVLRERLGTGVVILGSYGIRDRGDFDAEVGKYVPWIENQGPRPHTFLDIGNTSLSTCTIVDITADQFRCGINTRTAPAVYIGALVSPWSLEQGGQL